MELNAHFKKFLANIEPTTHQKGEASTGHNTLRSRLERDNNYKQYYQDSFISGSYGRDTAIRPINDVDIVVIANHTDSWQPSLVLHVLEKALKNHYSSGKIVRQGRSVRVSLSYVTMDVVPAITTNGLHDKVKIPNRRIEKWVITHPRRHLKLATTMNANKNGLYKPLVKALKHWRDNRMQDSWKPKSFLLECLVYYYAMNHSISSIPRGIKDFFWYTHGKYEKHRKAKAYSPVIMDPAGTSIDVAGKWSYLHFCKFMDELNSSWLLAYRALESTSYSDSLEKWRKLLGTAFPTTA